jgi:manganese/zinc/iron transport system permease protein
MIEQLLAYNTLVVLAGVGLLGASAGMIGSFAVLRKQSLVGDAVAHAGLPGVCIAFVLVGERSLPLMLLGALGSGIVGMVLLAALARWTRVKEDAAIGIVLSVFPGLGCVLMRLIQNQFTNGAQAGLESFIFGKTAGMTRGDVYLILIAAAVCLATVLLLYKEFKVLAFDRGFASALGWPVFALDLLLMTLIALAVVIGLPAVGAVMMAALLIIPAAAARFWTDRLSKLLWLSAAFGLATGLIGTMLSATFEKLPAGPIIVLTGSAIFVVSLLLGIKRGLIARWVIHVRNRRELRSRWQAEELEDDRQTAEPLPIALAVAADQRDEQPSRQEAKTVPPARRTTSRPWILPLAYSLAALLLAVWWLWRLDSWRLAQGEPRQLSYDLGTIAIGIVGNAACAILGCYLVLRRMSLLGDAISHSVLPGLAIAFLLTGEIYGLPMVLGAMALGMLTSFLTQTLHSLGKVSEDASMGVVFTTLFAAGVVMLGFWGRQAHIDANCVLFGLIEYAWTTKVPLWGWSVPRALLSLTPMLLAVVVFVAALWKELKIVAFDPALAAAMGFRVAAVHYLLMAMVAGVTVSAFESLGSVLVVAMLIVPGATAALMTERLWSMILWAVLFGAVAATFGYLGAASLNTNVAGMMAVVAGLQFGGAVVFAPRTGLVGKWLRQWSLAVRIAAEDVIGRLFREEERTRPRSHEPAAAVPLRATLIDWLARWKLTRRGYVTTTGGTLALTDAGRAAARRVVRAHRLWESFLETHFDLPADHLHEPAERMEHFLDEELQAEIDAELAGRTVDPHGKEIPAAKP